MSSINRHRSLLLTFCAFALFWLASVSAVLGGVHPRFGFSAHGMASAAMVVAGDGGNVAHDAHDPSSTSSTDDSTGDSTGHSGQFDDDCDMDDKLFMPIYVHVMPQPLRSGAPVDAASSLRSAPSVDLLRPPRAA